LVLRNARTAEKTHFGAPKKAESQQKVQKLVFVGVPGPQPPWKNLQVALGKSGVGWARKFQINLKSN